MRASVVSAPTAALAPVDSAFSAAIGGGLFMFPAISLAPATAQAIAAPIIGRPALHPPGARWRDLAVRTAHPPAARPSDVPHRHRPRRRLRDPDPRGRRRHRHLRPGVGVVGRAHDHPAHPDAEDGLRSPVEVPRHRGPGVKQGQVIGLSGTTGWSTGCHLHFDVIVNDRYVDPAPYLGFAPSATASVPYAVVPHLVFDHGRPRHPHRRGRRRADPRGDRRRRRRHDRAPAAVRRRPRPDAADDDAHHDDQRPPRARRRRAARRRRRALPARRRRRARRAPPALADDDHRARRPSPRPTPPPTTTPPSTTTTTTAPPATTTDPPPATTSDPPPATHDGPAAHRRPDGAVHDERGRRTAPGRAPTPTPTATATATADRGAQDRDRGRDRHRDGDRHLARASRPPRRRPQQRAAPEPRRSDAGVGPTAHGGGLTGPFSGRDRVCASFDGTPHDSGTLGAEGASTVPGADRFPEWTT